MESLLSSRSSHYTALKDVVLFGCPVILLAAIVVILSFLPQSHDLWTHIVVSITPGISGIVAASCVAINLLVLHKREGSVAITCGWCWTRKVPAQLSPSYVDKSNHMEYGTTTNSCPTKFEPSTESVVDCALGNAHHQI